MLESPQNPIEKNRFYRALFNLSLEQGGSFDIIRQHLLCETNRLYSDNVVEREELRFRQVQGALQILLDLEKMIAESREILVKLEKGTP